MNIRGSFLVYQSFSRLFPRVARLSFRPASTGNAFLILHQHGSTSVFPTSRNFSVGSRSLSTSEQSEKTEKQGNMPQSRERTVFVTNFRPPITEGSLREHFAQFGEVESFSLARTKVTNRALGYAFVKFKSEDDVENVLRQSHILGGRQLVVQKSRPILPQLGKTCFVQVRNVDPQTRKEVLQEHFSKYGSVLAIDQPVDIKTNSKGGLCFVQFSSVEEAERAANDESQTLCGQEVLVQKSSSKVCTSLGDTNRVVVCADETVESIVAYFGKFGKIKSVWGSFSHVGANLMPMFSLLFEDEHSVKEISKQTHFIQEQEIYPQRGLPKPVLKQAFEKKIVVDKLPDQVNTEDVIKYFRHFGNVQHCHFLEDPQTGKTLNCTVTFMTLQDVNKVMVEEKHQLLDKEVRVRRLGYRNVDDATTNIVNVASSTAG